MPELSVFQSASSRVSVESDRYVTNSCSASSSSQSYESTTSALAVDHPRLETGVVTDRLPVGAVALGAAAEPERAAVAQQPVDASLAVFAQRRVALTIEQTVSPMYDTNQT